MKALLLAWALGVGFSFGGQPANSPTPYVDLHVHLTMTSQTNWLYQGGFDRIAVAQDWDSRWSTKVNASELNKSPLGLVVASLYAHPLLVKDIRTSIDHQIKQLESFVHKNPHWMIAKTPQEARQAIRQGQRVIVLSLEGAWPLLKKRENRDFFLEQRGIRIVGMHHLTDTPLGGVAFLKGILALTSPRAWFSSFFKSSLSPSVRTNPNGLKKKGKSLLLDLIRRGIWVDLSHASDHSLREMIPLLKKASHPLLFTHTSLRKFHKAEFGIPLKAVKEVAQSNGLLGLMTVEGMVRNTPVPEKFCSRNCFPCTAGVPAFLTHYEFLSRQLKPSQLFIGSDFNAPVQGLDSHCLKDNLFGEKGFYSLTQLNQLFEVIRKNKIPVSRDQVTSFIKTWEKVRPYDESKPVSTRLNFSSP